MLDRPRTDHEKVFEALSAYKAEGIPTKVVIDANGIQRFYSVGFVSDAALINEMEAAIQLVKELS